MATVDYRPRAGLHQLRAGCGSGQARPGGEEMAGQDSGPTGVGHSVLAAPDGTRVAEAGYDEEILYGEVDVDTVAATRKALPVLDA